MRLRIASIAMLFGAVITALSWITLQTPLKTMIEIIQRFAPVGTQTYQVVINFQRVLPFYLALDLVVATLVVYGVLHWTVGRPLASAEQSIQQLSNADLSVPFDSGGPLLSRLQTALKKMAAALQSEQVTTRTQLTELQATNQQLMRAQSELVASDRLATVGKLAAGVAHEVGNPLSGILGYLSLLQSRPNATPEQIDLTKRIEGEVQRIDQIVRSLLELGRPSRGQSGPVELGTVLDSSLKLLSSGPEFRQVRCQVKTEPGLYANCEAGPLSQVVINLAINAAQAMNGEGVLDVSASTVDGWAEIRVRDRGPGLPPAVLARLFEPFFTTKAAGKGTGLGLAVSRHLIEVMKGELTAVNHPEGGALFTVRLPLP